MAPYNGALEISRPLILLMMLTRRLDFKKNILSSQKIYWSTLYLSSLIDKELYNLRLQKELKIYFTEFMFYVKI
jgi:hypothetical protein